MILFILKRLFYLLFSIPIVVFIAFFLIKASPIDPVEQLIDQGEFSLDSEAYSKIYTETARNNGLDKPLFYFSISTSNYDKDFYQLVLPADITFFKNLLRESFDYQAIKQLHQALNQLNKEASKELKPYISSILLSKTIDEIDKSLEQLQSKSPGYYAVIAPSVQTLKASKSNLFRWIPSCTWHGLDNQYHQSISKIFRFDLGASKRDGRAVQVKIRQAFSLTLLMIILALLFCYPFSIWLGKQMFIHRHKRWPGILESILFMFASIPLFWLATMALSLFTTPEYAKWLHIFPSVSNFDMHLKDHFWQGIWNNIHQLILPIICMVILELAIVTRQIANLLQKEAHQVYINTAKMKGLDHKDIIHHHMYRSARIQMITMISGGITSSLAGFVVIEYIFNILGIGRLLLDSIKFSDWPVLLGIILLVYILTNIIVTIADILINRFDPRLNLFDHAQ